MATLEDVEGGTELILRYCKNCSVNKSSSSDFYGQKKTQKNKVGLEERCNSSKELIRALDENRKRQNS